MEYAERVDEGSRTVFVTVTGILIRELGPLAAASRVKAKSLGYVLLFDFSAAKSELTLADVVNWFSDFYDPIDVGLKHVPAAHVVNRQCEELFRFLENAWVNRGGNVRVFLDLQSAIDWLQTVRQ